MTPPASLLWAHAPHHPPLADFVALYRESWQVVTRPCGTMVVPDVISACLSSEAWNPPPAAWWGHLPLPSPPHRPSPSPPCSLHRTLRTPHSSRACFTVCG